MVTLPKLFLPFWLAARKWRRTMFQSELNILGDIFLEDILQMERSHSDFEHGPGALDEVFLADPLFQEESRIIAENTFSVDFREKGRYVSIFRMRL
jgi:hypothetical protein